MPHILLRTSANLVENVDVGDVLEALVGALASIDSIDSKSIKAYHELHSHWSMGEGAQPGFAAVQVSIAEGRPEELLSRIADRMYDALRDSFCESMKSGEANLTVEVREFPKRLYRKES